MREEIVENISNTLSKPLEKERVVYLMVEVRKFIERSKEEVKRWSDIKYWCDWVVHSDIDRTFAKDTLNKMEEVYKKAGGKFTHSDFNKEFVGLLVFRDSLYKFLRSNNLSTLITDLPNWNKFAKLLVEHLKDCPLKKEDGLIRGFKFIEKEHYVNKFKKYSIDFKVIFQDEGRNFTMSGGSRTSPGLTLL